MKVEVVTAKGEKEIFYNVESYDVSTKALVIKFKSSLPDQQTIKEFVFADGRWATFETHYEDY